jgi:hypothetical protein
MVTLLVTTSRIAEIRIDVDQLRTGSHKLVLDLLVLHLLIFNFFAAIARFIMLALHVLIVEVERVKAQRTFLTFVVLGRVTFCMMLGRWRAPQFGEFLITITVQVALFQMVHGRFFVFVSFATNHALKFAVGTIAFYAVWFLSSGLSGEWCTSTF